MAVSPLAAAKRMCERSEWSLSNLELQKLLYIAHMFHLGEKGAPLIAGHFEAWDYGPVQPTVYHRLKVYGSSPVQNIFHSIGGVPDSPARVTLDDAVDKLGHESPGRLVAITHWEDGAWASFYEPGRRNVVIPNEAILKEYRDRVNALRSKQPA